MTTSNLYNYDLDGSSILIEAFDRCKVRPTSLTRDQLQTARRSLNLELVEWSNRGVNLYNVQPFTIQLIINQADYTAGIGVSNMPPYAISVLDLYLSQINGGGSGINIDRIMLPMGRTDYAEFSNKLQPGTPTMYWFQKTPSVQLTIYQPAQQGYPTYQLSGYYLRRLALANAQSGETVDVDYTALDALCAKLAHRLSLKFVDDAQKRKELKDSAKEAWDLFAETNREDAPITISPAMDSWYGRR